MRKIVCRPAQLSSEVHRKILYNPKGKSFCRILLQRKNDNVMCMGNQSAEANNGQNEAIQNKRVCSSHLMDGSKDACNRQIHCNKSELTSSSANTMERLYPGIPVHAATNWQATTDGRISFHNFLVKSRLLSFDQTSRWAVLITLRWLDFCSAWLDC